MKRNTRILLCLLVLILASFCIGSTGVLAAQPSVQNDIDSDLIYAEYGSVVSETEGLGYSMEGSALEGFKIYSEKLGASEDIAVSLNIESWPIGSGKNKNQSELIIETAMDKNIQAAPHLQLRLKKNGNSVKSTLNLFNADGTVVESIEEFSSPLYKNIYTESEERNNVQIFIGKDSKFAMGMEGVPDGTLIDFEVLRVNSSVVAGKEIKENSEIYNFIIQMRGSDRYFSIEAKSALNEEDGEEDPFKIRLMQMDDLCFYNYRTAAAPTLNGENAVYYSALSIVWNIDEAESTDYTGVVISRILNGVTEKEVKINGRRIKSFRDTRLEQGTEYSYQVTAYRDLDSPIPKLAVKYDEFQAKTDQGNMKAFSIIAVVTLVVLAIAFVLYVYRFRIKDLLMRRK